MKYLIAGGETKEGINLLLVFTKIESEQLIDAIYDHFCKNYSAKDAADLNDVPRQNVARAIKTLNKIAGQVEDVKNYHETLRRISKVVLN